MAPHLRIEPSILSADFAALGKEAKRIEMAGADAIHIDIMDGHFVPNLTLGPRAVAAINRSTPLFLDVHLMMYNPFDYAEEFIRSGADRVTFHFEATEDVEETIELIRKSGKKAGLAFRPETSLSMIVPYLHEIDLLLIMTVSPGFGGQSFLPAMLEKIEGARKINPLLDIQVDGGINRETGRECFLAGANILVSGSFLFSQSDMKEAIDDLRRCCRGQ